MPREKAARQCPAKAPSGAEEQRQISLEPPFQLAAPRKVPHAHLARDRADALIELENFEHAAPLVLGAVLPRAEHERDVGAKHVADVEDEFVDARPVPLELFVKKAVQAVGRVGRVVPDLHAVLRGRGQAKRASISLASGPAAIAKPPLTRQIKLSSQKRLLNTTRSGCMFSSPASFMHGSMISGMRRSNVIGRFSPETNQSAASSSIMPTLCREDGGPAGKGGVCIRWRMNKGWDCA